MSKPKSCPRCGATTEMPFHTCLKTMSETVIISEAAVYATILEEREFDDRSQCKPHCKPIGYHVQQLLNAETEKLRKENEELKAVIKNEVLFVQRHLERLEHREVKGQYGITENSFSFAAIPDWELKQKVESLNEALTPCSPPSP